MTDSWPETGATPWDAQLKAYIDAQDLLTRNRGVSKRVTANRTTTGVIAANVADMDFAVGANEVWTAEFNLQNGCSGTGGSKWALTIPAGATMRAVVVGTGSSATAQQGGVLTAAGVLTTANFNTGILTTGYARITVTVVNGATAGNVQLQFASATAGQISTVYADSYLTARKV